MTITKLVINTETGEETEVPYSSDEIKRQTANNVAQATADQAALDIKASRDAKLAKLGFTLDEIANW